MNAQARKTSQTTFTRTGVENLEFVLSDAATMAESAMGKALTFVAHNMGLDSQAAMDCLRQCDQCAYNYFYYSLAKQVAEWVGSWDEDVKAVYVYDYDTASEDDCFSATRPTLVNILVWAKRKTGALNSIMAAMDRALAHSYNELLGAQATHLLDAQVVDDDNITHRTGYGVLLSSVHYKPIRVWKR